MKPYEIYDIDEKILDLVDEETGEILDLDAFNDLQIEREEKIEQLCKWYINVTAEAKAIKEQKLYLEKRQKGAEHTAEWLKGLIKTYLNGNKFKTACVDVSYRKSQSVSVDSDFVSWAEENAKDLLTYSAPKASLTAVKEALAQGRDIKHAELVDKQNINIK